MRRQATLTAVCLSVLMAVPAARASGEGLELVSYMSRLQYFAHKVDLAIGARNRKLADLYAHELEEYLEKVEEVDAYDDHPVGDLAESMVMPRVERLEEVLEEDDWEATSAAFGELVAGCNACHEATDHGYIRIERSAGNPYMQSFEP